MQQKENDTLANFSAKDVARKQELNSEKDKLELELKETFDKKEQTFDRSYKLNLEKNEIEKKFAKHKEDKRKAIEKDKKMEINKEEKKKKKKK